MSHRHSRREPACTNLAASRCGPDAFDYLLAIAPRSGRFTLRRDGASLARSLDRRRLWQMKGWGMRRMATLHTRKTVDGYDR